MGVVRPQPPKYENPLQELNLLSNFKAISRWLTRDITFRTKLPDTLGAA